MSLAGFVLKHASPAVASDAARLARRSWWVARYRDGKEVAEYSGIDWAELPKTGLVQLRLHCPDGMVGVVGNSVDASDRLFQFKIAQAQAGIGGGGAGRMTLAQVIGIVNDTAGNCTLWAWEWPGRMVGPLADSYPFLSYGGPVTESGMVQPLLGAKAD